MRLGKSHGTLPAIIAYHQLGPCRSQFNWKWLMYATQLPDLCEQASASRDCADAWINNMTDPPCGVVLGIEDEIQNMDASLLGKRHKNGPYASQQAFIFDRCFPTHHSVPFFPSPTVDLQVVTAPWRHFQYQRKRKLGESGPIPASLYRPSLTCRWKDFHLRLVQT